MNNNSIIKQKLEYHYKVFDKSQLKPDPLQFPHLFNDEKDIEVMAFVASVFAYGNMKQIILSLNRFLLACNNKPYQFIKKHSSRISNPQNTFAHRFYSTDDTTHFFQLLKIAYDEFGSIKNLFLAGYKAEEENLKNAITHFNKYFLENAQKEFGQISRGVRFMFPLPEKGSACKRMNLFLRWMIRKDELDIGLWTCLSGTQAEIPTSKLIIPVDTHIAKICKRLKLTTRKNVSWKMAEEITNNLKKFDPDDPVKYDFALCHIGMRKLNF